MNDTMSAADGLEKLSRPIPSQSDFTADEAYEMLTNVENWDTPLAGLDEDAGKRLCVAICMAIDALYEQTCEALNTRLYQKMFDEQASYREKIVSLPTNEILLNAYDYVKREDILVSLEFNDLDADAAKALLRLDKPLQTVYDWYENHHNQNNDDTDLDRAWYAVESCAAEISAQQ